MPNMVIKFDKKQYKKYQQLQRLAGPVGDQDIVARALDFYQMALTKLKVDGKKMFVCEPDGKAIQEITFDAPVSG